MRIAVCDEDDQEDSGIRKLLAGYRVSREEAVDCHYFTNTIDFLCDLRGGEYDLVLFHVLTPGTGGIRAAQELRKLDRNVRLIFVSASPEFAVESYSVGAYYYLIKPIDADSFFSLLDEIGRELSGQTEQGFVLKSRDGVVRIAFARLVYVEVVNKTVFLHLADGTVRETTATLADFEKKLLPRPEFLKTHRSYLVNADYIRAIEINCVVMKDGQNIPVSRQRHSQIRDDWMRFLHREGAGDLVCAADGQERTDGPWRILLVDDDPADRAVWGDILQSHGCIVHLADNGEDALRLAAENPFDCVLLDVMIPGEDGFFVCEKFQKLTDTPIIFLSCLSEPDKQMQGFASGGIDYITKDTPAELFWAKVKTRIRLAVSERTQLCYGPLLLDLKRRRVLIAEKELTLSPAEFDILCCLSEHAGHVITPGEMHGMIWGGQPWDGGQMVQTHTSRLRRKLEKAWEGHRFIETVWGQGYRFVPPER